LALGFGDFNQGEEDEIVSDFAMACAAVICLVSCANTIKGAGRDTANTANATQNAGNRMGNAMSH
jgi:entericidin B